MISFTCIDCGEEHIKTGGNQKRCDGCCNAGNKAAAKTYREKNYILIRAKKHGLTEDELITMYADQEGCCPICGKDAFYRELEIDHDHSCCPGPYSCGKCVRGLVCKRHNQLLGLCKDNIKELEGLIIYLRRFK